MLEILLLNMLEECEDTKGR